MAGPGEQADSAPERRGYYLWPWTLYLGYSYGIQSLHSYVTGAMPDDVLAHCFRNFCYAVLAENHGLRDPLMVMDLNHRRHAASTGWTSVKGRDLDRANEAVMGSATTWAPMGRYNLTPSCPLSLRVPAIKVPRQPGGTLVVRRERPQDNEEFVALRPASGSLRADLPEKLTTGDMVAMTTGGVAVRGPGWMTASTNPICPWPSSAPPPRRQPARHLTTHC